VAGFVKLFGSIVHSTIWREPHPVRLVWITMLALSDRRGIVEASLPGLADAARVTLEECEDALKRLSAPDRYSRSSEHEGRRIAPVDGGWALLNHGRYRDRLMSEERQEKSRKGTRERVRRHREKQHVTRYEDPDPRSQIPEADPNAEAESRAAPPPAPARTLDFTESDDESLIPLDLVARADARGVFSDMLSGMPGVTVEQLRDKAREFVSFWTIGAGTGKKRRLWMRKLREDLRRAWREGKLRPPGILEHEARDGSGPDWQIPDEQRRRIEEFKRRKEANAGSGNT
jgi:hypothetical protein